MATATSTAAKTPAGRKQRKIGRPFDVLDQERSKRLGIRMTVDEDVRLKENAKTAGMTVANFVRSRTLGIPVMPPRAKGDAAMLHGLNAIGNNLNQLVKRCHAGDVRDLEPQLDATLKELREALQAVTDRYLDD